tara:strand:- start:8170 stop:8778 length:609 start_codon:yes stop_codon:yes gene_type:complete
MGFNIGSSVSNGAGNDWPKGVYIDKVKIVNIENKEDKYDNDISICIEGKPQNSKSKYNVTWYMNGNHAKDKGVPSDWGSTKSDPPVENGSWKIRHFLQELGVVNKTPMTEDYKGLSEECIRDCIDREVYILRYEITEKTQTGNFKRRVWFWYANKEKGIKTLLDKWNSYKKKPKNFNAAPAEKMKSMWDNSPVEDDDTPDLN